MTTIALPERWTFRGVDLSTYARVIRRVEADNLPPLRGDNIVVPAVTGERWARKRAGARRTGLALYVLGQDDAGVVTEPTALRQARANLDALYAVLGLRTTGSLVRIMPDGSTRTAAAEVVGIEVADNPVGGEALGIVVDFELADPWFYGATVVSGPQAIAASPTNFAIAYAGTVESHRLLLDFLGPIANPRLANLSVDAGGAYYVECLVTVAAGEHLLIDTGLWTAYNDVDLAIGSIRHSGGFEFMKLLPGSNNLRVTATSPGGSLTTTFAPAYL